MNTLETLYSLALSVVDAGQGDGTVDRAVIQNLLGECKSIPPGLREQVPEIIEVIGQIEACPDWGVTNALAWSNTIIMALEDSPKKYAYRPNGENWEVYSVILTGDEEWKATVETECLAMSLVGVLNSNPGAGPQKPEKMEFAVHLDGGLIQNVFCKDNHNIDCSFTIFDYDVESTDPEDLIMITQPNLTKAPALVSHTTVSEYPAIDLDEVING